MYEWMGSMGCTPTTAVAGAASVALSPQSYLGTKRAPCGADVRRPANPLAARPQPDQMGMAIALPHYPQCGAQHPLAPRSQCSSLSNLS